MEIEINLSKTSKLSSVDWNNIPFGKTISDHMFICHYRDGKWSKGHLKPYSPLNLDPSNKVFHYGQTIFEGMKAFKDKNSDIFMFRPLENAERFNKSAQRMNMPELPQEIFIGGIEALLKADKAWIPTELGKSYYIRPFMISDDNTLSAAPSKDYIFIVIGGPVGAYFDKSISMKIADHYSRAANGGVGFAKAGGNYGGQFYPIALAQKEGYDQVIWTDDTNHQYLEEAGQMNLMIRIGDSIITAPTSERILDGVTRKSIIQIAKDSGIDVQVRPILVEELLQAGKTGNLKEAFGVGTAAVISPINAIGYKETLIPIKEQPDSYAKRLKKAMLDIQYNLAPDPHNWRYLVKM